MKKKFLLFIFLLSVIFSYGQNLLPAKIKSIYSCIKYADTLKYQDNKYKWLEQKKEFYHNGLNKTELSMSLGDDPRDTSWYIRYELNKDSTLKGTRECNSLKSGFSWNSKYIYKKNDKKPFTMKYLNHGKRRKHFEYNSKGQLTREITLWGKKLTSETRFIFDSLNRIQQKINYFYKDGVIERYFSFDEYTYTQYKDSLVCVGKLNNVMITDEDVAKGVVIPCTSFIDMSKFIMTWRTFKVVTVYNSLNEIISEKQFNNAFNEKKPEMEILYLSRFYTYEYYK